MSLVNKSALVTGAIGGIGAGICEVFLKNGLKNLAALDLNPEEPKIISEWRQKFPKAVIIYFSADVSSHDQLEKCYKEFTDTIESLDIVVNCAGIFNESLYRKTVEVNVCGVIGSTLISVERMRKDKGGSRGRGGVIVNIASEAGVNIFSFLPSYCASKHAVVAFTRSLAHGRDSKMGIRFFTICPGPTDTQMVDFGLVKQNNLYEIDDASFKNLTEMALSTKQGVDKVSNAIMSLIDNEGQNSSVWIINNGEMTEHVGVPAAF
ncbi:hypothetical protein DMENIID0001_163840 [Sergentomyia squamirostris]